MNAMPTVPVSGRDWGVYRSVRVKKLTTREAAAKFGISQTRVCQIVERVGKYVLESTPDATDEQLGKQCHMAQQIAAEQVQHFLRQAMESFTDSKGEQETVRRTDNDRSSVTTVRQSHGDPRYLSLAARLAMLGAKLPVPMLAQCVDWDAEADEADEVEPLDASPVSSPTNEDCSNLAGEQAQERAAVVAQDTASSSNKVGCDTRRVSDSAPKATSAAPVQVNKSAATTVPAAAKTTEKLDPQRKTSRRLFFAAAG